MREILYKKRQSLKNRRKMISISEHAEDTECLTHVHKNFIYMVTRVEAASPAMPQPQIYINKAFNTKSQQERFSFRVKGAFYMPRDRNIFRVDFCHILRIHITWKNKIFSPKKSVTLT